MPLAEKMLLFAGTVTKNSGPEAHMYKFIHNSSALHLLARVLRTRSALRPFYEDSEYLPKAERLILNCTSRPNFWGEYS